MNNWKEYLDTEDMSDWSVDLVCLKEELEMNRENLNRISSFLLTLESDIMESDETDHKMTLDTLASLRPYLLFTLKKTKELNLKYFEQLMEMGERKYKLVYKKEYGLEDLQKVYCNMEKSLDFDTGLQKMIEFNKEFKKGLVNGGSSGSKIKIEGPDD
jgi:hypothetical protein